MSRETVLARARIAAAQGMVDTCIIQRISSTSVDNDTGKVTPIYSVIYTGKCKVRQRTTRATNATLGEANLFEDRLELHLPATAAGVTSDDTVTVTASLHDQDLVGRTWHLRGLPHATFLSARRYVMTEVSS